MTARKKIDRTEVADLTADGWTINELAEHYAVTPRTISRIRAELGIAHEYLGRPMTEERKAKIQAMVEDGWSHAEIHRTEGADPKTLHKHFPGTAWTEQQRAEHLSTLRKVNDWNGKHRKATA
jgi:DNA invertase Pin-like site-specific DNA recombinase